MTFESLTYKPNPKKVKEDNREKLYIAGAIVLFILVYIFLVRGLLAIVLLGGIAYSVIHLKISEDKKKGAGRFGSLVERLSLSAELLTIGDKQFKIDELEKFEIDAEDFLGQSTDFFGTSTGTDNHLEFTHNGIAYSYQFQVKRSADLKLLNEITRAVKANIGRTSLSSKLSS